MAQASGARTRLCYVTEVTRGTTPTTPSMKVLRATGYNINPKKGLLESKEIRSDRQVAVSRHGLRSVSGSIPFELALQSYDDMLESALGGTWAAGTNVTTIAAVAADDTFTRASGSFVTDGFRVGDWVTVAGFAASANNGDWLVISVAAGAIGVLGSLTDEAADVSQTVILKGKRLEIGTTLRTHTFERQFLDIAMYQPMKGCAINRFSLSVKPEMIVEGSFEILGMGFDDMTGTPLDASPDAAPTTNPMVSFDGALYENGSEIAVVTGIDLTLDNGRSLQGVVGSTTSPDVFEGSADVTGTLSALFENATMYNKFVNETESKLWCRLDDPDSATSFLNLVIPRLKYNAADMDPPAEGPIAISLPFRGLVDPTSLTSLSIQRSNS